MNIRKSITKLWYHLQELKTKLSNNYEKITRWMTASGGLIAAAAFAFGVVQFWIGENRSRDLTALQLLTELEKSRPPNSPICRRLVVMLDDPSFKKLLNREEVPISSDDQKRQALACFSNEKKEDLEALFTTTGLSVRGAAALAERINRILEADENIALAINSGIAHGQLLKEEMQCVIEIDYQVVERVTKIRMYSYYPAFDRYVADNKERKRSPNFANCVNTMGAYVGS
jgi:hypothetical protein